MHGLLLSSLLLLSLCQTTQCIINGDTLAIEIDRVADAVGMTRMQTYYDSLSYEESPLSGPDLVKEISDGLNLKFLSMTDALEKIRSELESSYNTYSKTTSIPRCCNIGDSNEFNVRFQAKVLFNQSCVSIPEGNYKVPTQKLVDVFRENYQKNPNLLWQYFGGEDGVYVNYPATKFINCDSYDPRYRPYFASTAAPNHKDVVIVIDTSNSMRGAIGSKNLLQIAKEMVITVIQTLNEEDRIGIVNFNDEPYTPDDHQCFRDKLALATYRNIAYLKRYINSIGTKGQTNYEKALLTAFTYFKSSDGTINGESRDRVILFLSDGDNAAGRNPLEIIKLENEQLNNSVVIHTYWLGLSQTPQNIELLQNMSKQVLNSEAVGEVKVGNFITDPSKLMTSIGSYYLYFDKGFSDDPVFSNPYLDSFSEIGLIVSMCLPINVGGQFVGVACTDIKLSELVSDISYFHQGEHSYAFMIDGSGTTLVHPLLPQLRERSDNSDVVNIKNFERSANVQSVLMSMKRGGSGTKPLQAMRVFSRGVILKEGDDIKRTQGTYSWHPVKNSNFSVCVVIEDGDTKKELKFINSKPEMFMYHNRFIRPGSYKNCRHYKRLATTDRSGVMLTPSAFIDPYKYLSETETAAKIKKYEDFLRGVSVTNPGLKDTVKNSVAATYELESIWKTNEQEAQYIVWRYICTEDGVVRMYPGVQLTKDYDSKLRPWYIRTIAQKKTNVISAPYLDAWGSGYLITLSKVIFKGRSSGDHPANDTATGVIGTDFPISFLYQFLHTTYPVCNEPMYSCLVIDNSGFLVMHPSFVETSKDPELKDLVHITSKEEDIAKDMISEGILYRLSCLNVENQREQFTYRVTMSGLNVNGLDRMSTKGYEIRPVRDTNIFVILKRKGTSGTCCSNPYISPDQMPCGSSQCSCLCYKQVSEYNDCENRYTTSELSSPCSARITPLNSVSQNENVTGLPTCFNADCSCRPTTQDCYSVAQCSWCSESKSGTLLEKPYCDLKETCPFGRCTNEGCKTKCRADNPTTGTTPPSSSKESFNVSLAVGVSGGVAIVAIVAIVINCCCRRMKRASPNDDYIDAVPSREEMNIPGGPFGYDNKIPDSPPPKYNDTDFTFESNTSGSTTSNPYIGMNN